jgi:hypothetical protein
MKKYIKSDTIGKIAKTGEKCIMRPIGFWVQDGRRITSYEQVDKEVEYDDRGRPVRRQYSMDRYHRFWVETEDTVKEWELS